MYILKKPKEGAKAIRTKYRVLAEKRDFSLLEVELLTGRTHQIRATSPPSATLWRETGSTGKTR